MEKNCKSLFYTFAALCLFMLLASCAAREAVVEVPKDLYWPLPPEKPRIKWVGLYSTYKDVENKPGFIESLVGEEVGSALWRPQGVVVDPQGNIYVADSVLSKVFVFDIVKKKLRHFGEGAQEQIALPLGLAVSPKHNMLFVAAFGSKKVIGFDLATETVKIVIGQEPGYFRNPVGVAVDEERGRIYVTDSKLSELRAFDMTGRYLSTIAKAGSKDNELSSPSQVYVDREGRIYVADLFNFRVKVFNPDGSFRRVIGLGIGDSPGTFSRVYGVAVDSEGHIYATDANFCNVQIFDQEGRLLMAWGSPGNRPGLFIAPMHLWIDKNDRIYVTDSLNHRVQVFQYLREQ